MADAFAGFYSDLPHIVWDLPPAEFEWPLNLIDAFDLAEALFQSTALPKRSTDTGTRFVKAEYLGAVDYELPEAGSLHVWRNPETGKVVAIDQMETRVDRTGIRDPYEDDVWLVFHDTFTGLPK